MRSNKTKKMILNAILLGIGMILNQIVPAIGASITPDLTLVMLFCIVMINRDNYKICLISGIITGVFTALTTKFPGGQVPNIVDKVITVNIIYLMIKSIYLVPVINKIGKKADLLVITIISAIGTMVSGFTFLSIASVMVGLPAGLIQLFVVVILPTVLVNAIVAFLIYNVIALSLKRSSYQIG